MPLLIYDILCGYEYANDANALRSDPLFELGGGWQKKTIGAKTDLASGPTFSRFENTATKKDLYRIAQTFIEQ